MDILKDIGDYIGKDPELSQYDIFYSLAEVSANNVFPCICINIGYGDDNSEKQAINYDCRTFYRNIGIMYLTKTKNPGEVEEELMNMDESIVNCLWGVYPEDLSPKLDGIKYLGSVKPKYIFIQPFRQNFKDEVMTSEITVNYELEYNISP
jgi:hypothetical protein